uniref:Amino acid permease/ SLC12A domain-containing protein n=1 Tax=Alexandrium catenella TaxID=2925 RepID=A0A7S1RJS1_ALECA
MVGPSLGHHAAVEVMKPNAEDATEASPALPRVLTVWSMVGLIFFEVSGGTYGVEPVVQKAGDPIYAVIGLALVPFLWSVPIALMTAEMCSAYPNVGGKIYFVQESFGSYIGWLNGAFNAVSNVFDVATLPAMALGYVTELWGKGSDDASMCFACVMILAACLLNIRGVELVGLASALFTLLVCAPFALMVGMGAAGLPKLGDEQFVTVPMSRLKFLSVLLWNMSGYDDAGATAAEVVNPQAVYPRSLAISIAIITASYILPVLVGLSVQPDVSSWRNGEFVHIGALIGGPVLASLIALLGVLSSFGQLNALLCSSVREVVCLAELPGQPVPRFLARLHPRFLTPHVGTALFSSLLFLLINVDFTDLVAASMFFDCFSFMLQFAAWVRYRSRSPDGYVALEEPHGYRAPIGLAGVVVLSAFPVALCTLAIAFTLQEHGSKGILGMVGTFVVSTLVYWLYPRQG